MIFCSETAEWFSFGVFSTPKEELHISEISATRAKRAVNPLKLDHNLKSEMLI